MSAWAVGLTTFLCVLGSALGGMCLRRLLPEHHLSAESIDVVKVVTGLIATLSALVLGLLTASAKNSFDAVDHGFKEMAAKVILIDRTLAQYGPGAKDARDLLRTASAARLDQLFPTGVRSAAASKVLGDASPLDPLDAQLQALAPADDLQRDLKARAQRSLEELAQARWLSFEEANSATPPAFLVVLVAWLASMFVGFGLFTPCNTTALAALVIGALAVSTSVFLIEEMSRPLDGLISISGEPLRRALAVLGR